MNLSEPELTIRVQSGMDAVLAENWDLCANPEPAHYNPFLSHAFLLALEESGCASAETGWLPQHLIAEDAHGSIVGAMPLYLKSHS